MYKIIIIAIAVIVIAAAAVFFMVLKTGKRQPAIVNNAVYTCPMHPEVISDKPGKCPKCGMNLVVKETPSTGSGLSGN